MVTLNHNQFREVGPSAAKSNLVIIGGVCALSLAMGFSRFGFTPIIPLMQRDLSVSSWEIALMASANYLGYMVGAYASRQAFVRSNLRAGLGFGIPATVLLLAAMSLTLEPLLWHLFRFLSGFLSAVLFVVASSVALGQDRSDRAGFLYSGVGIGIALTGMLVPLFDSLGGWRMSWQGLALFGSLLGAFAWFALSGAAAAEVRSQPPSLKNMLFTRNRKWYALLAAYGIEGIGYIITATFIVQIIKATPAISHVANQSWVLIGLAAAPSTLLWSRAARVATIRTALMFAFGLQALGILLTVMLPNEFTTLLGAVLFGGTFMGITSLTITLANRMKPGQQLQAIGELTAVYALGQVLGPMAAAYLQKHYDNLAPSYFAALILILALCMLKVLDKEDEGAT